MASGMSWFRVHSSVLHNAKLLSLSPAERWFVVTLWCLASESSERGVIRKLNWERAVIAAGIDDEITPSGTLMSFGGTAPVWERFRDRLVDVGLVKLRDNGDVEINDWAEWNPRGDRTNADRQSRYRKRYVTLRGSRYVTLRNGTEKRREEKSRKDKKERKTAVTDGAVTATTPTSGNGECPEHLAPLEARLRSSDLPTLMPRINPQHMFDWAWWLKQEQLYAPRRIDIIHQIGRMEEWAMRKPHVARKRKDFKAFVSNWLERES